jgi:flagellar motor switch protein FliN/FliY
MPDEIQPPGQEAAAAPAVEGDRTAIESLLNEAQSALSSLDEASAPLPEGVKPFELKDLFGAAPASEQASLDLLRDVQLDLKIELGRTQMHLDEVLRLKQGAVVTLDKLAGDPVDIYANGRLIARGEVLVLNDNFCVRVAELIAGEAAA